VKELIDKGLQQADRRECSCSDVLRELVQALKEAEAQVLEAQQNRWNRSDAKTLLDSTEAALKVSRAERDRLAAENAVMEAALRKIADYDAFIAKIHRDHHHEFLSGAGNAYYDLGRIAIAALPERKP
jgi:predicted CopG family antitoxin